MTYKFPILERKQTNISSFIKFWEKYYDNKSIGNKYTDEKCYWANIGIIKEKLIPLKEENIKNLFKWKHGKPLNTYLTETVEKLQERLTKMNRFRELNKYSFVEFKKFHENVALECFKGDAPVYSIFTVHISNPLYYPIIDQNVVRAYIYITTGIIKDLNPNKYKSIYDDYSKFFSELINTASVSFRSGDKALFGLGDFLKYKAIDGLIF